MLYSEWQSTPQCSFSMLHGTITKIGVEVKAVCFGNGLVPSQEKRVDDTICTKKMCTFAGIKEKFPQLAEPRFCLVL